MILSRLRLTCQVFTSSGCSDFPQVLFNLFKTLVMMLIEIYLVLVGGFNSRLWTKIRSLNIRVMLLNWSSILG
jgi:hypothetical protein